MKLSPFGKAIRAHRLDREMTLAQMASRMGLSSAFASAVETGAKSIPSDFVQKVVAALDLTASQRVKLEEAAEASAKEIRIPLSNASRADREVAAMFARRFPDMPASRKADLRKLLEEIEE